MPGNMGIRVPMPKNMWIRVPIQKNMGIRVPTQGNMVTRAIFLFPLSPISHCFPTTCLALFFNQLFPLIFLRYCFALSAFPLLCAHPIRAHTLLSFSFSHPVCIPPTATTPPPEKKKKKKSGKMCIHTMHKRQKSLLWHIFRFSAPISCTQQKNPYFCTYFVHTI